MSVYLDVQRNVSICKYTSMIYMHEAKRCWYMNICILTKYAVFSSPVSHRLTHLRNLSMTWNGRHSVPGI